jgi:hypothetical protein
MQMAMIAPLVVLAACSASPNAAAPSTSASASDLQVADAEMRQILLNSCYPCHANERSDPWYAHLAPSSWSSRGRAALNFDEWQTYEPGKRNAEAAAIVAVVQNGDMPLKDYTFFNGAAKLNEAQRQRIVQWASTEAQPAH